MKQPKWWYGFKVSCDLYEIGISNMSSPSKQQYCRRSNRPKYDLTGCSFQQCPKFKDYRKKIKNGDIESIRALKLCSFMDDDKIERLTNNT